MYQHVFEEDEDLPRVRRAAADEVQDEDVVGGNGGLNDLGLIKNIRSKCSTYFLYFLIQEKERNFVEDDEDTYVDLKTVGSDCPQDDYRETITFNPICNLEVVCDNYGCFDYFLRDFKEKVNETHRCPSCAKEECWLKIWLEHYEKGYLDIEQVSAIFSASRTADFSDMLGVYSPSKDDIGKFSMPAKEFIKSCSYDRRPCNHKQFFSWTSDQFGQCYTFNSAFRKVQHKSKTVYVRVKSTTSTGPMNGLRLSLNINANEYVSLLSPDIGVRVIVHSPHQLPFPEEEGFNVSPGDSVSVSVSRKVIQRVGYPHGRCRNESGSSIYKEYTSIGCKKLCLEEEYWRECGCYVGKSPVYHRDMQPLVRPDIPCSPFNVRQKLCMEMVQYSYLKGKLTCPCPPACKETVFMPQATVSRGNQKFFTILQNLKKTMVDDSLCNDNSNNSDPVRLHFYMDSLSYEKIEESPAFTWNTLVCNVGGNLGLFLGMSIVTLVELLEFLIDLLFSCCNFRKSDATRGGGGGGRGSSPVIAPPEARPAPPPPHQPQDSQWWERENYSSPRRVASAAFNRIFLGE
ncbi:amiloride-sensitive sodium channel subunit alpha-like [Scylla paramamosain]|uniref:amiloride-sensitive sodium channel subunit alpha-like n=1 Tax=Scylla paramamosain TaxID=85552 RepID=UPI0030836E42